MSGLAGLLAHHVEPGIYTWHGHFAVEDVRHTVEHAGWRFAAIDGWHGPTKPEFLAAIGEALAFPAYYGQNFDALADCLADVTAGDSEGWVLLWDGWGPLARDDERAFSVALSVLGGRVNADKGGRFAVLLRAPLLSGRGGPRGGPTTEGRRRRPPAGQAQRTKGMSDPPPSRGIRREPALPRVRRRGR